MLRPHAQFDLDPATVPPLGTDPVGQFQVMQDSDGTLRFTRPARTRAALGYLVLGIVCALIAAGIFVAREAFGLVWVILLGGPAAAGALFYLQRVPSRLRVTQLVVGPAEISGETARGTRLRAPTSDVHRVRLAVTIWVAQNGLAASSQARLTIVVRRGGKTVELVGPESPERTTASWRIVRDMLAPAACALCRRTGRELEVVYQGFERGDGTRSFPVP